MEETLGTTIQELEIEEDLDILVNGDIVPFKSEGLPERMKLHKDGGPGGSFRGFIGRIRKEDNEQLVVLATSRGNLGVKDGKIILKGGAYAITRLEKYDSGGVLNRDYIDFDNKFGRGI